MKCKSMLCTAALVVGGCLLSGGGVAPPRLAQGAGAPARVWVPGYWNGGVWFSGHWRYRYR